MSAKSRTHREIIATSHQRRSYSAKNIKEEKMRLNKLSVRNLRVYGDKEQTIEFDPQKKITVLLGDNGAGKTSLLYGLSVLLSQFYKHFPGCSVRNFTEEDVRVVDNTRRANFIHVGIDLVPTNDDERKKIEMDLLENRLHISVDIYKKGNITKAIQASELKAIADFSLAFKNNIDEDVQVSLPIIAFYGTERGQIKPVERRRNFNEIFPRWEVYKPDSLESATDFKRFFTWFERNEDLERREQIRLMKETGSVQYSSHVLDTVREALNRLFPNYLKNPRVETSPLRFVMDDITDPQNILERRLERMSDGYRITIALVADIASRMAEANPSWDSSGLTDPLATHGIVMIDEIDLHLHPKLQRDILRRLTSIFPNIQFIVSTHSPSVVLGALDIVQVVKLDHGVIDTNVNTAQYEKYDVSLVLLSDLFGLENVRNNDYLIDSKRYEELLSLHAMNDHEKAEFDELGAKLDRYTSHDVEIIRSTIAKIQGK